MKPFAKSLIFFFVTTIGLLLLAAIFVFLFFQATIIDASDKSTAHAFQVGGIYFILVLGWPYAVGLSAIASTIYYLIAKRNYNRSIVVK